MARCDECKHWNRERDTAWFDWEGDSIGFGLCMAVRPRWIVVDEATHNIPEEWPGTDESEAVIRRAGENALKATRAYVQDGSEYRADLITGPDFFCALFEAKP